MYTQNYMFLACHSLIKLTRDLTLLAVSTHQPQTEYANGAFAGEDEVEEVKKQGESAVAAVAATSSHGDMASMAEVKLGEIVTWAQWQT